MPTRNQSGKPSHVHQNKNRKRSKSGKKYEKLFQHCKMLKKRETRDGMNAWLVDAWKKVERKMKKYSVSQEMIDAYLKIIKYKKAEIIKPIVYEFVHLLIYTFSIMARLRTSARRKLRQALIRVKKVVVMDIRKQLDQQRKWKAEVVKRKGAN